MRGIMRRWSTMLMRRTVRRFTQSGITIDNTRTIIDITTTIITILR